MSAHEEILAAARRLCRERRTWTFRLDEVVRALPHLNTSTVRTHIVSRCCVNAPKNHPHRWKYFRRVGRGKYEILPAQRRPGPARRRNARVAREQRIRASGQHTVAETTDTYRASAISPPRETVHTVVTRDKNWYVAECLEISVVTQGRTLDELVANLREAIDLHLEGEDPARTGVVQEPRISLTYEVGAPGG